jgi:hypothetical protein
VKQIKKRITIDEKVFRFITEDELTTSDLSRRLFGMDDYFSKQRVINIISRLRKRGIDFYPDKEGIWRLPKNLLEHREAIAHKISRHYTGFKRTINFIDMSEQKFKELVGIKKDLLTSLNKPTYELPSGFNLKIKTRPESTKKISG